MNFEVPTKGRWPSGGDKPAAMLRESVPDLERRLGVAFSRGRDDLDAFDELPLRLESGRLALLQRYDGIESKQPTVYIDSDDDFAAALKELRDALGLGPDPFEWVTPVLASPDV